MKKITLLFIMLTFSFGFAQNGGDTCETAVAVTPGAFTATLITQDSGGSEMGTGGDSAWFAYTATEDGTLDISSCNGGADSYISVGTGTCGALAIEEQNDDSCASGLGNNFASELSIAVTNGTVYYLEWDDRYVSGANAFDWSFTFTALPPAVPECADTPTPANGAEDVIAVGGNVTLSWVPSMTGEPADEYEIFGGTEPGVLTSFGFVTELTVNTTGNAYDTTYYWMIVPTNALGAATGCTEWSYTTGSAPPVPTNDECDAAISLVCGMPLTGTTDDPGATDSGGNPAADVWYVYENLGVIEDVTVSLCGSGYDTNLRVYTDCPGTTQIATNDDSCGLQSQLTFTNDGVGAYYIMVEGYNTSIGEFIISATCDVSIPAPVNDNCDASIALTIGISESGTTAGATDQGTGPDDDTTCDPFDFHADVWYSVTLSDGPNDLVVTTTTTGTSDEAGIAIYPTECDFLDASSIACGGGDDPDGAMVTANALADGTYYIRVWSNGVAARSTSRIEGTFDIVADASLSTTDFENELVFTFFPNPVNDNLTLNAQKDIQNVIVYNVIGQEVLRAAPNTMNTEVNMSDLQSGAYFVKVTIEEITETIRIIKN
jgi:hypothetical protein